MLTVAKLSEDFVITNNYGFYVFYFADEALRPWPQALGRWILNDQLEYLDLSYSAVPHHATVYNAYFDSGLVGASYVIQPTGSSYLEINNANEGLSFDNSFTFSTWVKFSQSQ